MLNSASASNAPLVRPQVLVDGHNIDGVLGLLLARRPQPNERPQWDRVKEYLRRQFEPTADLLFVIDQSLVRDAAFGFYRALRALKWQVKPVSQVGRYPGNDDPVDEFILDQLHDALTLIESGQRQPV